MSCLPPPPLSITAPSLSSVRAHVRAWHWRGAPLGSLRVAAGDMRAPPAPQCRGIQLWSADLVSVWTEGAVPCITPRTANVFEGRLGACVR